MIRFRKYLYVWLISAFAGIIIGSLFQSSYFDDLKQINDDFFDNLGNYPVYIGNRENIFLLFKIISRRCIPFLLMWILERTNYVIPYIIWSCVTSGLFSGFYVFFMFRLYGPVALRIMCGMLFPHMIPYAFVYAFSVLCIIEGLKRRKKTVLLALTIFLLSGCIMETYVNPKILRLLI